MGFHLLKVCKNSFKLVGRKLHQRIIGKYQFFVVEDREPTGVHAPHFQHGGSALPPAGSAAAPSARLFASPCCGRSACPFLPPFCFFVCRL